MPVITNRNTSQAPMNVGGRTGEQVVKFIPASRVYVKTPDSQSAAPVQNYYSVSDGNVPAGWIDLGVISNGVAIKYNQKVDQVTTGIDNYMRSAYLASKDAELSFSLSQFDDVVISTISGINPIALPNNAGFSWGIGSTDLVKLAVLLVSQDKLTGKEFQFYNPCVYVSFQFDYQSQALELKCTGYVPFFTPVGSDLESLFCVTIYSPATAQAGTYVMSFSNRMAVTIPHMLGTIDIVPTYIDSSGFYTEYGDFQIIDSNNGLMTFSQAVSGYVTIVSYGLGTGFSQTFNNQTTLNVTHNLGTTAVGAIVYDLSNRVIQYTSVTALDANNVQVVFSDAESGRVLVYVGGTSLTASATRLIGTNSISAGTILDGVSQTLGNSVNVPGALIGNATRIAASPALPAGVFPIGKVTANDTVSVEIWNLSGASVSIGSRIYTAMVFVNGGTYLSGSAQITPGTILDGQAVAQGATISVPGANVGSPVEIQLVTPLASGVEAFGKVTSSGTVTVEIWNFSGSSVTLAQATYTALVLQ